MDLRKNIVYVLFYIKKYPGMIPDIQRLLTNTIRERYKYDLLRPIDAFYLACEEGNMDEFNKHLSHYIDTVKIGYTISAQYLQHTMDNPVHLAIKHGHVNIIKSLLNLQMELPITGFDQDGEKTIRKFEVEPWYQRIHQYLIKCFDENKDIFFDVLLIENDTFYDYTYYTEVIEHILGKSDDSKKYVLAIVDRMKEHLFDDESLEPLMSLTDDEDILKALSNLILE